MTILSNLFTMVGSCAVTFGIIAGTVRGWGLIARAMDRRRERERRLFELLENISSSLNQRP
jgi:hypothetical protein